MIRIQRALLSAYYKEGLVPLAQEIVRWGGTLVSSGGTAAYLREAGLPVTTVEEMTGLGSLFGGRVKTLHPTIHGGILFRRDDPDDRASAREAGVEGIDLVAVNLYPFHEAIERKAGPAETVELIDIGGPAMVRAAAKNHRHVAVITRPEDYGRVRAALEEGKGSLEESFCLDLAASAFRVTAEYDAAIAGYLARRTAAGPGAERADGVVGVSTSGPDPVPARDGSGDSGLPEIWTVRAPLRLNLRYGENPSQAGGLYGAGTGFPFSIEHLHGKELSFNNLLDLSCGRDVAGEFGAERVAVVVKHGIPCGTARGASPAEAYRRARDCDSLSAFGGVVILKEAVDEETAAVLDETFIEAVLAPDYEPSALEILKRKKKRALLRCPALDLRTPAGGIRGRFAGEGFLLETPLPARSGEEGWTVVTKRAPSEGESADLRFGWRVLKHVRSNGILLAREGRTIGVGAGQCSRVDSVDLAIRKARREGHEVRGSVLVSDAFFPFRDNIDLAAEAGITAVLQPGGSVRDEESIQACDEQGLAMAINGSRVFSHG